MKVTIQQGIDARGLQGYMYDLIRAGMECDAKAARKRHQERLDLIRKGGGGYAPSERAEQGSLFGEGGV
jgi:hypothetical protein